jgi:hypothetical protein
VLTDAREPVLLCELDLVELHRERLGAPVRVRGVRLAPNRGYVVPARETRALFKLLARCRLCRTRDAHVGAGRRRLVVDERELLARLVERFAVTVPAGKRGARASCGVRYGAYGSDKSGRRAQPRPLGYVSGSAYRLRCRAPGGSPGERGRLRGTGRPIVTEHQRPAKTATSNFLRSRGVARCPSP